MVALMFFGEYVWRVTRFPHLPHAPLLAAIRAFRQGAGTQHGTAPR
jgi:hypothetical protein